MCQNQSKETQKIEQQLTKWTVEGLHVATPANPQLKHQTASNTQNLLTLLRSNPSFGGRGQLIHNVIRIIFSICWSHATSIYGHYTHTCAYASIQQLMSVVKIGYVPCALRYVLSKWDRAISGYQIDSFNSQLKF